MPDFLTLLSPSEKVLKAKMIIEKAGENPALYGLTQDLVDELEAESEILNDDIKMHNASKAEAAKFSKKKKAQTKKVDGILRKIKKKVKLESDGKPGRLLALALVSAPYSLTPQASVPHVVVDTSNRFQHKFTITDEAAPALKRKPKGVMGCDIYAKIGGEPPADETGCRYVTIAAKSVTTVEYTGEDVGKQAHYMFRWRMRDGSTGAWSETVSATITG